MSKIFIGDYVISNKSIKNIYNNYITSYKNYPRDFNSIIINENEILFGKVVNISKGIFLVKSTKITPSFMLSKMLFRIFFCISKGVKDIWGIKVSLQ